MTVFRIPLPVISMTTPKKIFISYNHKDTNKALLVMDALLQLGPQFNVWFDRHDVKVGDRLADEIRKGMDGADYYLLLISENSNQSEWVKRELSLAFDLSREKALTLVPMILDEAELPLEFKGLLYVDASKDFYDGLKSLVNFFKSQIRTSDAIAGTGRRGSAPTCVEDLGKMPLGDLRFLLTKRLSVDDVTVLWFDIFNVKMETEVPVKNLPQCCVELIDRSRREELLIALIRALCRNHPRLAELAKAQ